MSPKKKKARLDTKKPVMKKISVSDEVVSDSKQISDLTKQNDVKQSIKRKNFVKACEQVSFKGYFNYGVRFSLMSQPCCTKISCHHHKLSSSMSPKQISTKAEESFKIEMKSNMWQEALDICFLSINPKQYLSHTVLQDVIEIILNAHENVSSHYTITSLLERCQQILTLNFNMHPPCIIKKCYLDFLTAPMDLKENTFSNRAEFYCQGGLVKYCLNRLEAELSEDSKDGAIVSKIKNTPEDMKQGVQGLHWQKEKFEIFETLDRPERIERLLVVLESLIELLQIDVAIWHTRYTNNLGSHIMRSHKPLMAHILWSHNILYTGAVTNNIRQILRLFILFVHLQYPEQHIKTMIMWLNTMIQTFYICDNNSNSDYPNTGKYCAAFANEFYKIISEIPHTSVLRIIEQIQPTFMRHLISLLHLKTILSSKETDIIKIFIVFIQNRDWEKYPEAKEEILWPRSLNIKHIKPNKLLNYLSKKCYRAIDSLNLKNNEGKILYPKSTFVNHNENYIINQVYVVTLLYISLHAYLDAYNVQNIQETWDALNDELDQEKLNKNSNRKYLELNTYSVSESFILKYRSMYKMLKELVLILHKLKSDNKFPYILGIFKSISLLDL